MPVLFHNADIEFTLNKKVALEKYILRQFKKDSGFAISLSVVFCSDEFLLNVNQQFLEHDYYTDVITFPLEKGTRKFSAEMYISIDRVRENAAELNVPFDEELQRVIFHGALHLCGFDDKTDSDKILMQMKENEWIVGFAPLEKRKF